MSQLQPQGSLIMEREFSLQPVYFFFAGILVGLGLYWLSGSFANNAKSQVALPITPVIQAIQPIQVVAPPPAAEEIVPVRKVVTKKKTISKEKLAQVHGMMNQLLAQCWRQAVDNKIEGDVRLGQARDWGNVLKSPVCDKYKFENYGLGAKKDSRVDSSGSVPDRPKRRDGISRQ